MAAAGHGRVARVRRSGTAPGMTFVIADQCGIIGTPLCDAWRPDLSEKRKIERTEIEWFAKIRHSGGEFTCKALDLSVGGIRLELRGPRLDVGLEVDVDFELPDTDRTMALKGQVAHHDGATLGIEFKKPKAGVRKAIEAFVAGE